MEAESAQLHLHLMLSGEENHNRNHHAQNLANDCRNRSARNAHGRNAQITENKDRVEDDVRHRADELEYHRENHVARCLERLFNIDFNKYAERKDTDNTHVINAQLRKLRLRSKSLDKGTRAEYTNQGKNHPVEHAKHKAVCGSVICFLLTLLSEAARHQRVNTDARPNAESNQQRLDWENQRNSGQGVLTHLRHEIAVDDIIQSLHEHGKHGGQSH